MPPDPDGGAPADAPATRDEGATGASGAAPYAAMGEAAQAPGAYVPGREVGQAVGSGEPLPSELDMPTYGKSDDADIANARAGSRSAPPSAASQATPSRRTRTIGVLLGVVVVLTVIVITALWSIGPRSRGDNPTAHVTTGAGVTQPPSRVPTTPAASSRSPAPGADGAPFAATVFRSGAYTVQGQDLSIAAIADSTCDAPTGIAAVDDIITAVNACVGVAQSRAVLDSGLAVVDTVVIDVGNDRDATRVGSELAALDLSDSLAPAPAALAVSAPPGFETAFAALDDGVPAWQVVAIRESVVLQRVVAAEGSPITIDPGVRMRVNIPSNSIVIHGEPHDQLAQLVRVIVLDIELAKLFG